MNKAMLMGRLTANIEVKKTNSDKSVATFTLAIDRGYGDKKSTDWIDCVAWGTTAEFIGKYFHKGDPIIIDGSIQTRTWEDKEQKKRKATEVIVNNVEFVLKSVLAAAQEPAQDQNKNDEFTPVDDIDDLPF